MKKLYLECSLGVSGDMLLAGLSDLVPEGGRLLAEAVASLGLPGVSVRIGEQMVQGIRTRLVTVLEETPQPLRHLKDLTDIILAAPLPARVQELSLAVLTRLAEAEAKVHGEPLERVHFHEVGAVDTVVDVLGSVLLALATGASQVLASPVNLGSGFITFSHGRFPVPAPASAELSRGMSTFATDSGMELATPTGLAVVKTLAEAYGPLPQGSIEAVGYGSGTYSTGAYPTFLRAYLIESGQGRVRSTDMDNHADDRPAGPSRGRGDLYGPHGHPHHGDHGHMSSGRTFLEYDEHLDPDQDGHDHG
jgi:pyridinium-3,5-bisthiocarboxylic acid mononucleotide nickel chelatase